MIDAAKLDAALNEAPSKTTTDDARRTPPQHSFARPYGYTLDKLAVDERAELVPLAGLPQDHGWGADLQDALGGGLKPGEMVAVGAARAGAGKTAFLSQLADGLAMRGADLAADEAKDRGQPLTPVLMLSEMDADALARRTMARLCGVPVVVFRSGPAAIRLYGRILKDEHTAREMVAGAYRRARDQLTPGQPFASMMDWIHVARPDDRTAITAHLVNYVERWRDDIAKAHPTREVCPIVVVDPIQRWQDHGVSEVEALNKLAEDLDSIADERKWIAILTSDTNKTSAKGDEDGLSSAAVFRGSYKLIHACEAVLVLGPDEPTPPENDPSWRPPRAIISPWNDREKGIVVVVDKNRNGPAYDRTSFMWRPAIGKFRPEDKAEAERRRELDRKARDASVSRAGASRYTTPAVPPEDL